jgi:uncharacterized membrane protein
MIIDVLMEAGPIITLHVAAAVLAVVVGPVALYRCSRDIWHRVAGVVWVLAMALLAGTSLFIHEARMVGAFSVIHVLSLLTLAGLGQGLWALYRGNRRLHGRIMRALYLQALVIAGIFTFLPGRRMSAMLFADTPMMGFVIVMALGMVVGLLIWRDRAR